jgi:hypothetical protein
MFVKKRPLFIFLSITLILQLLIACSPTSQPLSPQFPSTQAPSTQTPAPQNMQGERWVIFPEALAKE